MAVGAVMFGSVLRADMSSRRICSIRCLSGCHKMHAGMSVYCLGVHEKERELRKEGCGFPQDIDGGPMGVKAHWARIP